MQCAPKLLLMFEQFYKYNFCGDIEYAAGHCVFSVATFRTAIKTWGDKTVMKQREYEKKW